jgi:formylmethanofuran dehydrogenase subunit D
MRFTFISGRSTKQGRQLNIGKDCPEYDEMVSTLQMNSQDIAQLGLSPGNQVIVRSLWGEATFTCVPGDLPPGIVFVLFGPPTGKILSVVTNSSGMPIQKGLEVEIEPAVIQPQDGQL